MANSVPTLTPVETHLKLSMFPALYLSPITHLFGGEKEIAVLDNARSEVEENQICNRIHHPTTFKATALKIATYILSAGILPLLALVLNYVIRSGTNYVYVDQVGQGNVLPGPGIHSLVRNGNPPGLLNQGQQSFELIVQQYANWKLTELYECLQALGPDDNLNKNAIEQAINLKLKVAASGWVYPDNPFIQPGHEQSDDEGESLFSSDNYPRRVPQSNDKLTHEQQLKIVEEIKVEQNSYMEIQFDIEKIKAAIAKVESQISWDYGLIGQAYDENLTVLRQLEKAYSQSINSVPVTQPEVSKDDSLSVIKEKQPHVRRLLTAAEQDEQRSLRAEAAMKRLAAAQSKGNNVPSPGDN